MTEQIAAFPESAVRQGKEPTAAADIMLLPKLSVWELKPHPRNVRKHNLAAIAESLRLYGQQSPIIVQLSTGFVCKGNGTLAAARDILGWGWLYASAVDMDEETALRYLLADNRASDLADYDRPALSRLLKEQDAGSVGLQGTLWDLDAAETLWAEMGQITVTAPEEFRGGYAETPEDLQQRIDRKSGWVAKKEVVLLLKGEDYEFFALAIAKLSRAYGTSGVIATVLEAIRRANAQVVA